ncbi:MAG: phospholipid transport system transporter-binding protein [Thiomicrorhabdus sp.]|nr:MAG: phospholipid transport system transporter-binding protein [Thiomicrorhabdus sp.]
MSKLDWSAEEGLVVLPETVTLETIPTLIKSKGLLSLPVLMVDFSQVTQVDSAALALLLTWSTITKATIGVKNAPPEILTLIQLYDLESVVVVV